MVRGRRVVQVSVALVMGAALTWGLAACTGSEPVAPSTPPPSTSAAPEPPEGSVLLPDGTAEENLAYFDSVNTGIVTALGAPWGRDFIDGLTAAGFDRANMQVTADRTSVDLEADSVQFSVLWGEECLVGQFGPKSDGYHSAVRPALGTGGCLVGATRPIDW